MDSYYVGPGDNGRWILRRMDDMEALILLSRRVHYVEMQRTYALPDAGCVYARTHPLFPRRLRRQKPSLTKLSAVFRSGIHRSRLDNRLIGWSSKIYTRALITHAKLHREGFFFDKNTRGFEKRQSRMTFLFRADVKCEGAV